MAKCKYCKKSGGGGGVKDERLKSEPRHMGVPKSNPKSLCKSMKEGPLLHAEDGVKRKMHI